MTDCPAECCMASYTTASTWQENQRNATSLKKCKIRPEDLETAASDHDTWWQRYYEGTQRLEEDRTARRHRKRLSRNTPTPMTASITTTTSYSCPTCNRICGSRIGLFRLQQTHR
ncbi:LOW QUALITY PROTEIN: uncharacterized protein LOC117545945 [Xyrichtys novacula]|uniref:LOW QUALITY PROTEIN: uncharacterized protein LOC117545945 n=1 Tax=Xyrichtys novacula TaxID=13765 RepID=A0AAV1H5J0_XYRNO|nr:LOW QUALITY PROTEIN: uncharacterized protein LOC117545945 [Xyrichtys novacula]